MVLNFERTPYFKFLAERDENLRNEGKIFRYSRNNPQYSYGERINYQDFPIYSHVDSKGWVGRKFAAIPMAICSGLVKTLYHLAKAIFLGIADQLSRNGKSSKIRFFYVIRDLQESLGWITSLFNDTLGQYLIQKSGFHKSCYRSILFNIKEKDLEVKNLEVKTRIQIATLAELHLTEGKTKNIMRIIDHNGTRTSEIEYYQVVLLNIGERLIEEKDFANARIIYFKIRYALVNTNDFAHKLISAYVNNQKFYDAYQFLNTSNIEYLEICNLKKIISGLLKNHEVREPEKFYLRFRSHITIDQSTKLVHMLVEDGKLEEALKIARNNILEKDKVVSKIAREYLEKNGIEKTIEILSENFEFSYFLPKLLQEVIEKDNKYLYYRLYLYLKNHKTKISTSESSMLEKIINELSEQIERKKEKILDDINTAIKEDNKEKLRDLLHLFNEVFGSDSVVKDILEKNIEYFDKEKIHNLFNYNYTTIFKKLNKRIKTLINNKEYTTAFYLKSKFYSEHETLNELKTLFQELMHEDTLTSIPRITNEIYEVENFNKSRFVIEHLKIPLITVSKLFLMKKDKKNFFEAIKTIIKLNIEENLHSHFSEVIKSNKSKDLSSFYSKLVLDCYKKTYIDILNKGWEQALLKIKEIACHTDVLPDFISGDFTRYSTPHRDPFNHYFEQEGNIFGEMGETPKDHSRSAPIDKIDEAFRTYGLQRGTATKRDVNVQYRKMARQFHPDKVNRKDDETLQEFKTREKEAEDKFKVLVNANETLMRFFDKQQNR